MKDIDENNTPLEFPCDFPLKIMGRDEDGFREHVIAIISQKAGADAVVGIRDRESKGGRFISLTVTVRAESRPQLDDIYRELHASDRVLMTL
ncbi:YbeD family protein [Natronospira bacteriovora]|uniref:UPF0250 protein RBH19_02610 n=1 Tax=Natronospira bacteriovora TaxID=3069753 RepID=A0ABU0W425_9GAMM|nr:DUF493 domain-containing protein [Natronospira sp. AB-CW4]MDQ2068764.1 DUF493 domain-containing protein [Natronospira sp. AB-CW4]